MYRYFFFPIFFIFSSSFVFNYIGIAVVDYCSDVFICHLVRKKYDVKIRRKNIQINDEDKTD